METHDRAGQHDILAIRERRKAALMPSKSPAQARLMAAAAHTPGGFGGVPQSVGKDFNSADKGTGILRKAMTHKPTKKKTTMELMMERHGS